MKKRTYLEFEKPIESLESKIESLQKSHEEHPSLDITRELKQLEEKLEKLHHEIYNNLNAWQISQVSRHPQRPYTLDYINSIFSDFKELHGDRTFSDDPAIVGGLANFENIPLMVIGHQKGRDTQARIYRNYGMPRPEGYRKAKRIMEMAERFKLPVLTFIDTPGAYPGVGAEERGQSEAIASNLRLMSSLKTPIISTVIGEGGSGGALAIGVADCILMLQFSTYSVISPEGCASILWKSADKAKEAAEAMGITAQRLLDLGLIDKIIEEPLGGAHRGFDEISTSLKKNLLIEIATLQSQDPDEMVSNRVKKFRSYGTFKIKQ